VRARECLMFSQNKSDECVYVCTCVYSAIYECDVNCTVYVQCNECVYMCNNVNVVMDD
jgi:hypothetical protein